MFIRSGQLNTKWKQKNHPFFFSGSHAASTFSTHHCSYHPGRFHIVYFVMNPQGYQELNIRTELAAFHMRKYCRTRRRWTSCCNTRLRCRGLGKRYNRRKSGSCLLIRKQSTGRIQEKEHRNTGYRNQNRGRILLIRKQFVSTFALSVLSSSYLVHEGLELNKNDASCHP